jgi:serine/threonine protein kinase
MAATLHPGTQVGEYRIVRPIGSGAMGEVYEACHPDIGKRVAIKVMKAAVPHPKTLAIRMLEEARAVNAIRHSGIVDIFGANVLADGRPYLVMELLEGKSLNQHFHAHQPLSLEDIFDVLEGILPPLAAAHRAGVIHRDLKTTNIFLAQTEAGRKVKLLDFGVALREGREVELTNPTATVGSVGFMGPEHMRGEFVAQSDLYSVGCIAWLLLAGRPVFSYRNVAELALNHFSTKPPGVRTVRADAPPELEEWVSWLLEKAVDSRPFNAEVALLALREAKLAAFSEETVTDDSGFMKRSLFIDTQFRRRAKSGTGGPGTTKPKRR